MTNLLSVRLDELILSALTLKTFRLESNFNGSASVPLPSKLLSVTVVPNNLASVIAESRSSRTSASVVPTAFANPEGSIEKVVSSPLTLSALTIKPLLRFRNKRVPSAKDART